MKLFYRPYKPTSRDMEIYNELCKGRTLRDVGEEFGMHHRMVMELRINVELWEAPKMVLHLKAIKKHHAAVLNREYRKYIAAFEKSRTEPKTIVKVSKKGIKTTIKRYSPGGDLQLLDMALKKLAEIREIWNIEKHNRESAVPESYRRMKQAMI